MKREKKLTLPDLKEFTDESGKKWIQTSADDLFSISELNKIIKDIEQERERDEIVLARIDFQKVDREFYEAAVELQKRLEKQTLLLQKFIKESKELIAKKNRKLKELIEYIKKLHLFIAYLNAHPDEVENISVNILTPAEASQDEIESVYEEVMEIPMSDSDKE